MHITPRAASWPLLTRCGFDVKIDVAAGEINADQEIVLVLLGRSLARWATDALTQADRVSLSFVEVAQGADCPVWHLKTSIGDDMWVPMCSERYNTSLAAGILRDQNGSGAAPTAAVRTRAVQAAPAEATPAPAAPRRTRIASAIPAPAEPVAEPAEPVAAPMEPSAPPSALDQILAAAGLIWLREGVWGAPGTCPDLGPAVTELNRVKVVLPFRFDFSRLQPKDVSGRIHIVLADEPSPARRMLGREGQRHDKGWDVIPPLQGSQVVYDGIYDALVVPPAPDNMPYLARLINQYDEERTNLPPSDPLRDILGWENVSRLYRTTSSTANVLAVITRPMVGTLTGGVRFYAGPCLMYAYLNSNRITFHSADGEMYRLVGAAGAHCYGDGSVCAGTASSGLSAADPHTRIAVALEFLRNAVRDDGLGCKMRNVQSGTSLFVQRQGEGII